jgi:hypothetical protein
MLEHPTTLSSRRTTAMIFIDNKYTRIYNMIIERAQSRTLTDYTETHHIFPRSLGGSDKFTNLAVLTAREHYICHLLLPRMLTGESKYKMLHAYIMMSGRQLYNSKAYATYKKEYSILLSEHMSGEGNPMYGVDRKGAKNTFYGRTHTQETRDKISKAKQGHGAGIKREPFTLEHRAAISRARSSSASIYNFVHKDGSLFTGTTRQLSEKVGSHPAESWKLVNGQYKTHKGWKILQ